MNIDKPTLHKLIEEQILSTINNAITAASQAYETATHKENKAENKYDTLGLEAAYLAEGQSKRVLELEQSLASFQHLEIKHYKNDMEIGLSALVCLASNNAESKYMFISPVAGGTLIQYQDLNIVLITPSSPLGTALINSMLGDEISLNGVTYEITNCW